MNNNPLDPSSASARACAITQKHKKDRKTITAKRADIIIFFIIPIQENSGGFTSTDSVYPPCLRKIVKSPFYSDINSLLVM